MATISELYFRLTGQTPVGDWEQMAYHQGERLADEGVPFSEFGTRRRHSYAVHDRVLQQLILGGGMHLQGTSNVHLAMKYKLTPVGTHAHEWFMAFAAMYGYRNATREALEAWEREYTDSLGVALADTFTTPVFLRSFTAHYANLFKGVRQDSGDPYQFVDLIVKHYQHYGIDPMSKTVLFSDGLDYERAIDLFHYCQGVIQSPVAIGTKFTNNVGRKPLNMVIKMTGVQLPEEPGVWTGTVKLSDNYREKATGSPVDIRTAMRELHLS